MKRHIPQTYENHRSYDRLYLGVFFSLIPAFVISIIVVLDFLSEEKKITVLAVLVLYLIVTQIIALYKLRKYPLVMQDRIIALETRLKLEKLLPKDEHWQIRGLSIEQLIGLHYASDEELPELMMKSLDQRINNRETIKRMIKNWTPDYDRI